MIRRSRVFLPGMLLAAMAATLAAAIPSFHLPVTGTAPSTTAPSGAPTPASGGAAPSAITPAPSSMPADNAVQADQILQSFPFNALVLMAKGQSFTVVGRVLELREIKPGIGGIPAGGKPAFHVLLVGGKQNAAQMAHITCDIDPASQPAARALKLGSMLRLTGTSAGVTMDADRVDLTGCHDLATLPDTPVYASMVQGTWRANLIGPTLTGWRDWGHFNAPRGGAFVEFRLGANSKAVLLAGDALGPLMESKGSWALVQDAVNGLQIRLVLEKYDPVFVPVSFDGQNLKIGAPKAEESKLTNAMPCTRIIGRIRQIDDEATADQLLTWLKNNVTLTNPAKLMQDTSDKLLESIIEDTAFTAIYGGGLLKSHKTTQVCLVGGRFITFELTDAQVQRSGVGPNVVQIEPIKQRLVPMVPEVKVDSLELDGKDTLTMGKDITGKITLRSLRHAPQAQYTLVMESAHGIMFFYFTAPPSADPETIEFKLPKPEGPYANPSPLPVVFSVCRADQGEELAVSEPIVRLMDISQ